MHNLLDKFDHDLTSRRSSDAESNRPMNYCDLSRTLQGHNPVTNIY